MRQDIKERIEQIQKGIVPEGYKKTKVGIIPEDWEVKKLNELAEINSQNIEEENMEYYYYDLSAVNEGKINHPHKKINYNELPSRARRIFEKGDILFSTVRPNLKGFAYIDFEVVDSVCSTGFVVLSVNRSIIGRYIYYQLFSYTIEKRINSLIVGSNYPALNAAEVSNLYVPYTKMKEQQRIASILETWDRAIELKEKLIQEKQTQKKGVMDKLLSTKNKGWETVRVGEIFNITRGNVLAKKKIRAIRDEEYKFPVYSSQTRNSGLLGYYNDYLYENAITWTTDGANAGDTNFRSGKFYCTNVCGVLLSDEGYANTTVAEIINRVTKKYVSYVGNPKLMNNTMSEIKITLPPLPEQQRIAKILSTADREIELLKEEVELLKQQKKGLMQLLLTGIIRV